MHLRHKVPIHGHAILSIVGIDVLLELREGQLIAIFEVAVVFRVLLHRVVRQMNESIVDILQIDAEFCRGCPQVAFFEEEYLMILIKEHPDSDVELAPEDEQGSLDILLNDERIVLDLDLASACLFLGAFQWRCLLRGWL